ncbi:GWxTD domain-containing protein [candidate division KSB1 bacterium]|nr:GWxTD domain-containing protein [candidate division KSB1 bacterium]RQW06179.1 MAG: GWxTD domain-containing protein [candidate division KSB1 bacterium]
MKNGFTLIFSMLSLSLAAVSPADRPLVSSGQLTFYLDRAHYLGHAEHTFLEFYLMLYADQLAPAEASAGQIFAVNVTTEISDLDGRLSARSWKTEAELSTLPEDMARLAIYDQWAEQLRPGHYRMRVTISDSVSQREGDIQFDLTVPDFAGKEKFGSDIEFISRFYDRATAGPFAKGNRTIIPNPSRRYGVLNPQLYFYYELYGLPAAAEELTITYAICTDAEEIVKSLPPQKIETAGERSAVLHGIDVARIPSGLYLLSILATNADASYQVALSRPFEVLQLDYFGLDWQLSEEAAHKAGQQIKYLATKEEYDFFQSLTIPAKAQFLTRFWRQRDPSPETLENELLQAIQRRFIYANDNFAWGKTAGWETDRGRVLIQNGMPDNIGRNYAESGLLPFEIWYYQQDRAFEFVFGDRRGDGHFILLHSTKEGEVRNNQWRQLLQRY